MMASNYLLKSFVATFSKLDLLEQMVTSKLIAGQKDLILGYVWWVLEPILYTVIYWFLVGVILQRGGPDYPLFLICGLIPYRAFTISFGQSTTSVSSKFNLISHINFPRIYLPICDVIVNHIKLIFGFVVIVIFALFYRAPLNYNIIHLIVLLFLQVILLSGLGMIMSILGVYFRDIQNLMQFIMRALLFLSPILYSIERIPEKYRTIYILNPIASLVLSYRDIILYGNPPHIKYIFIVSVEALILFLVGYLFFISQDKKIMKYI